MSSAAFGIDAAGPAAAPGVTRHAAQRFAEHFGRAPPPGEWRAAVLAILDGGAVLLRRFADGGEEYAVAIGGDAARVAWKPEAGAIVTVMGRRTGGHRQASRRGWKRRPL